MPPIAAIGKCANAHCSRVGPLKRKMCYPCYQLWLKRNPNPTNLTAIGKICRLCEKDKPLSEYTKTKHNKSGIMARCKTCVNEYQAVGRHQNPGRGTKYDQRWRESLPEAEKWRLYLLSRHRLTPEQYDAMLKAQGGGCAICGHKDAGDSHQRQIHVDHNHETGKIRGLLCGRCNRGLGLFTDDLGKLAAASSYLLQHTNVLDM
jgi:nitrate/TMAO reductase-like tetraheme cytochrome c subunit